MGRMIGIDLGTTNCCIAVLQDGDAQVINSRQGERTMPSVVAFSDEGTEIVGTTAQRQAVTNPNRTIFGVKRLIGRKFGDEEIETWSEHVPYEICAAPNGDDFDRLLIEYLLDQFEGECGQDISDDPVALQRLKESAETAKRELSSTSTTSINLPFIATGPDGPLHLRVDVLERTKVERLCEQLIDRLEAPCKQALADAGIVASDLDQVLLVGGMTRMPAVQAKVEEIFGKITAKDVNPDEIVAVGAATQCAIMTGEVQDVVLLDVTPHSLGVRVTEGRMSRVIEKNTTIPTSEKKLFATTRDQQDHVEISVYQGEDDLVDNNSYLGRFVLGDLPQAAAGKVNVEVTFLMDADGVLNVKAREVTTGREASVKIAPSSGLSKDEVRNLSNRRRKAS